MLTLIMINFASFAIMNFTGNALLPSLIKLKKKNNKHAFWRNNKFSNIV